MSWPSDTLAGVFLFLFAFGLIFSVASLLLGGGGGDAELPGDLEFDIPDGDPGADTAAGTSSAYSNTVRVRMPK